MLKDTKATTLSQFLTTSLFARQPGGGPQDLRGGQGRAPRASPLKIGRHEADAIYQAIQQTKISPPATDCISPIGEELLLKGLHHVVPGEFYVAATRPPAVYRGNPFLIEVGAGLRRHADGQRVPLDTLTEMLARERRPHAAAVSHHHVRRPGRDGGRQHSRRSRARHPRLSPGKLKTAEIAKLHEAMQSVNLDEGQTMNVLRYANRVPLQFQHAACAITQMVMRTNWRSYGLSQSRGSLPAAPVTVMVHMASVWVPFTSESKEAIASYPEIQKELRLALASGRAASWRCICAAALRVKQEGERRQDFPALPGRSGHGRQRHQPVRPRQACTTNCCWSPKRKPPQADMKFDENGKPVEDEELDFGENVLIVDRNAGAVHVGPSSAPIDA